MNKFELSITPDYVPEWSVVDAVRELFQNALDQQIVVPDNEMFFEYTEGKLFIGNKRSTLAIKSLLLGESTKRGDDETLGKFGEGYKIATLVLLRMGKKVVFYNYGAREVWYPKLVNSKRYGTRILTFFVDKQFIWQRVPDNDLTIVVDDITAEEYTKIVASNLHLQGFTDCTITDFGRVLHDERHKGKVYVNGLFVCDYKPYKYGYDFKPKYIRIDRDRKLVSDFDLRWLASKMWANINTDEVFDMMANGLPDVEYVNHILSTSATRQLSTKALESFIEEYGENAIPVSNQSDLEKLPNTYKPIMVNDNYKTLLTSSPKYEEPVYVEIDPLSKRLVSWYNKVADLLDLLGEEHEEAVETLFKEFKELLDDVRDLED